jgi:hypothetical protein
MATNNALVRFPKKMILTIPDIASRIGLTASKSFCEQTERRLMVVFISPYSGSP